MASLHQQNVVDLVLEQASHAPDAPALIVPVGNRARVVSYGELVARTATCAARLETAGIRAGSRVLVLMRPDEELYALVLAVLAGGMTLVVVDGRASRRRLLGLLADAAPDVVIATPSLIRWWPLVGALRRARRFTIGGAMLGARRLERLRVASQAGLTANDVRPGAAAVVSFSSGNTGRSKAITRTHGTLLAQHRALAAAMPLEEGDINLPGFPLATLHNLCCGTASIIPPADLRAMADADPAEIAELLARHAVTSLSGAPSYIGDLARHLVRRGTSIPSIRRLVVGGGPVGRALCADIRRAFPEAEAHVVYGATEAEPITSVTIDEVMADRDREGFLVGLPVADTEVCLLTATGSRGTVGEVAVRGAQVASGETWHRTGDVGRFDALGRLWLLGRIDTDVSHHGFMIQPYVVEADALAIAGVRAAALIAHSHAASGELVVEPDIGADDGALLRELRGMLAERGLPELGVRVVDRMPMDARHASKVARADLVALIERESR